MSSDDKLKQIEAALRAKLAKSRVSGEIQHISGQFFAGTLLKTSLISIAHALVIMIGMWICALIIIEVTTPPICAPSCFWQNVQSCCALNLPSIILYGSLLACAFAGSFVSTRITSQQRFQRSATVSALILMVAIFFQYQAASSLGFALLFVTALFLALFFGYRSGCRL